MPSYKTHSIHSEIILPSINQRVPVDREDMKSFAIGPDTLIPSDYSIFGYQHDHDVKAYFSYLIQYIKKYKLQYNSEVMAFLYGQIDHYILDQTLHPFIYYYTEGADCKYKIGAHSLAEMYIDDYFTSKLSEPDTKYYHKNKIKDLELRTLIDRVYKKIYNRKNEAIKYDIGLSLFNTFDSVVRKSKLLADNVSKSLKIGEIGYHIDIKKILPYLNLQKESWRHPETGEFHAESLLDLWNKATYKSLEVIDDINKYLYLDKPLSNNIFREDLSYNTGLPCIRGQHNRFVKKQKILKR